MKKFSAIIVILIVGLIFLSMTITPCGKIGAYKSYYKNDEMPLDSNSVKVTFFGVSTLLFDDGKTQLLIDGFFSRPSFWQTATSKIASDTVIIDKLICKHQMTNLKGIFVTHSHYDHALDVAHVAKKTNAKIYGSFSTFNIGKGGGLCNEQLVIFKNDDEFKLGEFSICIRTSRHSSPTIVNNDLGKQILCPLKQPARVGQYVEGGSYDFLIKHRGISIYVKPSAHFIENDLKNIQADVLFLGVATLGNQTGSFRDDFYRETVGALKPKTIIPIHWDNFFIPLSQQLQMMPILMDNTSETFEFFEKKTKTDNIDFRILQSEKSIILHPLH